MPDCGQLWKNRGFLTSAGTQISNKQLVTDLLKGFMPPRQISVMKCSTHSKGQTPVDIGNRNADLVAKKVSWERKVVVPKMMRQAKSITNKSPSEKLMPTIQKNCSITGGGY